MTSHENRADSAAMTAAEFRVARESLGVTMEWIAAELGVAERTVRRWESGVTRVPDGVAADVRAIQAATDRFVAQVVDRLQADHVDDEDGESWWVLTYASDAAYRAEHPDMTWPAGWHRAAMGRVAQALPRVRIKFLGDADE